MGQAHSRLGVHVTATQNAGSALGANNKNKSASIYLEDCGPKSGITPSSENKTIIITDIINGASNSPLELAYKDNADTASSGKTTMLIMESATSHSFFMPLRVPVGKFVNLHAGAKVTIHYYEE